MRVQRAIVLIAMATRMTMYPTMPVTMPAAIAMATRVSGSILGLR